MGALPTVPLLEMLKDSMDDVAALLLPAAAPAAAAEGAEALAAPAPPELLLTLPINGTMSWSLASASMLGGYSLC